MDDDLQQYDHAREVKTFVDSKIGVKGLVEKGISKIPQTFIQPYSPITPQNNHPNLSFQVPVIDFIGLGDKDTGQIRRKEVVERIRSAAETWGFFQLVNHGVPVEVMEELLRVVRGFHELPTEVKSQYWSRDPKKAFKMMFEADKNPSVPVNWRDSFLFKCVDDKELDLETLPQVCRQGISEYIKYIMKLKNTLSELLSEALGLCSDYLGKMEFMKFVSLVCHYYPSCPEPELALGAAKHSDFSSLTIVLQDNIGGLQVLHQNHWVDVPYVRGALVVNLGDLMQLISNDKFSSVEHKVLAKQVGPRVSTACFFCPYLVNAKRKYGPIKDLLSDDNPPIYREVTYKEYYASYISNLNNGDSSLPHFKF